MSFFHRNYTPAAQPFVQLPANLLDAFIPGYGTISRLLMETFSFDITLIVSISFLIFVLIKFVDFLQAQVLLLVMRFGTCSVSLSSDIDSYFWMMDWLADHNIGRSSQSLIALPANRRRQLQILAGNFADIDSSDLSLPFRKVKTTQQYEPSLGSSQYFWHKGRRFLWYRQRERRQLTTSGMDMPTSLIEGRLYCISRSTAPLKALIEEASAHYHKKTAAKTAIHRPAPRQQRKDGGNPWRTVATRPSRPMDTVVLGEKEKVYIISDIDEYLHASTRRWYAERGIPYRRGYVSLPFRLFTRSQRAVILELRSLY